MREHGNEATHHHREFAAVVRDVREHKDEGRELEYEAERRREVGHEEGTSMQEDELGRNTKYNFSRASALPNHTAHLEGRILEISNCFQPKKKDSPPYTT